MNDSEQTMHFVTGMSLIDHPAPKNEAETLRVGKLPVSFPFLKNLELGNAG